MIRILCTGDSHTWGQGAEGLYEEYNPTWVGGELRLGSFRTGTYVNRLRNMVNGATGSSVQEWLAAELAPEKGLEFVAPCAVVGAEGVTVQATGALIRVECAMSGEESEVEILIDGETVHEENLCAEDTYNAYRIATLHTDERQHALTVRAKAGKVRLFRIESYSGPCAVINSGIGSCPVQTMREKFWNDYVRAVRPYVMLMEAHTINDWLTKDTPEMYRDHLMGMIEDARALGAEPMVVTVAPIGGDQRLEGLTGDYDEYVEASREAARQCGVKLCDANRMMKQMSLGLTEEQMKGLILADNWHVNDRGQAVYAQIQFEALLNAGYLNSKA